MVKIGLIGCGVIGSYHAPRIAEIPQAKIAAAVDIIPERAQKIAKEYGCQAFTDYRDCLDSVDAVWVCTPPDTHKEITVNCLNAGKHVFCEKPMALSLEDADEMIDTAKKQNRILAIGYCLRFLPWAKKCKELVDSGELGKITMAWITRMSDMPGTEWLRYQERSGGMLTEQTTHNLDWMRYVVGDVAEVTGMAKTALPDVTIRDNVAASVRFVNGAIGQVMASWSSAASWIESGLVGTKAVLKTGQGGPITLYRLGQEPEVIEPEPIDMYLEEDKTFIECIVQGKPWPEDPEEAKKSLAFSLAILMAAESGESIRL